jgi:hypothetical protein
VLNMVWLNHWSVKGRQSSPITGLRFPEGSRNLRFPDYVTVAQDGGKVVSLTHWPLFTPRKYSWHSFLLEAESTRDRSANRRIMSMKNSNDLPICSTVLNHCATTVPQSMISTI